MQYHYLQKKYGLLEVMHTLLLMFPAFVWEIMPSLQKRKNMRLKTIKYLLLLVGMITTWLPVYGSVGDYNTNPKRLSPALNYIYVEYTSIDKWSYSEDINGIGYGATSYGCNTTWADSQNELLKNKQLLKELTLEEFQSIFLNQNGDSPPLSGFFSQGY